MKQTFVLPLFVVASLFFADAAEARRTRVVVKTQRARVTVHRGFPIRRTLPAVVVRPAPVVRVRPAVYLAPVVFTSVRVNGIPSVRVWSDGEELEREDGWTEFTFDVDRRGDRLLLQIEDGAAAISFAEVVFENGETQVVDFDDKVRSVGTYSVLNFANGRKVDHVRMVARAVRESSEITLHLTN
ncbi:MAG TPA: hypothetical protein VF057_13880 [Thermoanaerobaculia bacterium]